MTSFSVLLGLCLVLPIVLHHWQNSDPSDTTRFVKLVGRMSRLNRIFTRLGTIIALQVLSISIPAMYINQQDLF